MAQAHTSFDQRLAQVNLSSVMNTLQSDMDLPTDQLKMAETLYRQFLALRHKYPQMDIVPPKLADVVWHHHMLDSRKYTADCSLLYGDYLHHNPHVEEQESTNLWQNTKHLYAKEFGVDVEALGLRAAECV